MVVNGVVIRKSDCMLGNMGNECKKYKFCRQCQYNVSKYKYNFLKNKSKILK